MGNYDARVSRPVSNLRLFVAAYPSADASESLLGELSRLDLPRHRPVPVEQIHLTVQFIGDTPAAQLDATVESVERSVAGLASFNLVPLRLITLPAGGPARLVAVECSAPAPLVEIHRRLVVRFAASPRDKPRDRFLPHMTLCRFASPQPGLVVNHPLSETPIRITEIEIVRSTLAPDGAQHKRVTAFTLNPA